jgi:hypothetical protein
MSSRWVDDGSLPPYSWKSMIGMILLDHKRGGDSTGLSYNQISARIPVAFSFYVAQNRDSGNVDGKYKKGYGDTVRKILTKETKFFVKLNHQSSDRGVEGSKANHKWVIIEDKEDDFVNPRRNTTSAARLSVTAVKAARRKVVVMDTDDEDENQDSDYSIATKKLKSD